MATRPWGQEVWGPRGNEMKRLNANPGNQPAVLSVMEYFLVQVGVFEKGIMKTTLWALFFLPFCLLDEEYLQVLWERTLRLLTSTQHHCPCVRWTGCDLCLLKNAANFKTPPYHVCVVPKYVFPHTLHCKITGGKWMKLRIKVKTENNNGLCCCAGAAACQVSLAEVYSQTSHH